VLPRAQRITGDEYGLYWSRRTWREIKANYIVNNKNTSIVLYEMTQSILQWQRARHRIRTSYRFSLLLILCVKYAEKCHFLSRYLNRFWSVF
jgi:hypothetical protein